MRSQGRRLFEIKADLRHWPWCICCGTSSASDASASTSNTTADLCSHENTTFGFPQAPDPRGTSPSGCLPYWSASARHGELRTTRQRLPRIDPVRVLKTARDLSLALLSPALALAQGIAPSLICPYRRARRAYMPDHLVGHPVSGNAVRGTWHTKRTKIPP